MNSLIKDKLFYFKRKIRLNKIKTLIETNPPRVEMIILNWNRLDLLQKTLRSLLATTPPHWEVHIVDNNSTDGSRQWLMEEAKKNQRLHNHLLESNQGGEALNSVLVAVKSDFILISENDLEYKPGWYQEMLIPFFIWPNLGQLSPLSPFPDLNNGEYWIVKPHTSMNYLNIQIHEALGNIGTSCLIRRQLIEQGVRWQNLLIPNTNIKMPADALFSDMVRQRNMQSAWSAMSQVINWGHSIKTWNQDKDYYQKNWDAKANFGIDGLGKMAQIESDISEQEPAEQIRILKNKCGEYIQEAQALKSRIYYIQRKLQNHLVLRNLEPLNEESIIFIDGGNGFTPNERELCNFNFNKKIITFEFNIMPKSEIKTIRWDPIEGALCKIKIHSVEIFDGNQASRRLNLSDLTFSKSETIDSWIVFKTSDPMVFIKTPFTPTRLNVQAEFFIL